MDCPVNRCVCHPVMHRSVLVLEHKKTLHLQGPVRLYFDINYNIVKPL